MTTKRKKERTSMDSGSSKGATAAAGRNRSTQKSESSNKKKSSGGKSLRFDIFSDVAMENAYYLCHNVQDLLKSRGFAWPDGQKKKKGK